MLESTPTLDEGARLTRGALIEARFELHLATFQKGAAQAVEGILQLRAQSCARVTPERFYQRLELVEVQPTRSVSVSLREDGLYLCCCDQPICLR